MTISINWDWVIVVGGVLLIAALNYFKPAGRSRWLTEARYYQITISLIGLTLFYLASITLGECLVLVVLGWMISLRFEGDGPVRSELELITQLAVARLELARIERDVQVGSGAWRNQKGYIDGLLYALGEGSE